MAQIYRQVSEGATPLHIVAEVHVGDAPLLLFLTALLEEVGEEVLAHLVAVEEAEVLVD